MAECLSERTTSERPLSPEGSKATTRRRSTYPTLRRQRRSNAMKGSPSLGHGKPPNPHQEIIVVKATSLEHGTGTPGQERRKIDRMPRHGNQTSHREVLGKSGPAIRTKNHSPGQPQSREGRFSSTLTLAPCSSTTKEM